MATQKTRRGRPRPVPTELKIALVVMFLCAICALAAAAVLAVRGYLFQPTAEPTTPPPATVAPIEVSPIPFVITGRQTNVYVEYIMDASGSMMEQLPDGTLKRDVAEEVLTARLSSFPPEIHIGLRAYGHRLDWEDQIEESCQDIELIAPVETGQLERIATWLEDFPARGMTPLSESIRQAAEDFEIDPARVNSIVLISDGMETCEGDPCALVEDLKLQGINFKLHVIGLHVDAETRAQLECIAEAGEGLYRDASSAKDLNEALADVDKQMADDQAKSLAGTGTPSPTPPSPTPTQETQPADTATPTPPSASPVAPSVTPPPPSVTPPPPTATYTPPPPTPTFTPVPPTPTFTPPPAACAPPQLASPANGQVFESGQNAPLQWSYNCQLAADHHFDVRVWREGAPHNGIAWTKDTQFVVDYETFGPGRLYWSIAVVQGQDGQVSSWVTDAAPERWFEWVEPTEELGTGDVQITLRWNNTADLDLHVIDPNEEEIYFDHPSSRSGGQLDRDANYPCEDASTSPVENIFWPRGGAPKGGYVVAVNYFSECYGEGTTSFTIEVRVDGEVDYLDGSLSPEQMKNVTKFAR